jgi:hypothetical protein
MMKNLKFFPLLIVAILFAFIQSWVIHSVMSEIPSVEWSKNYGGPQDDYLHSMTPSNDGGFVLCGYSFSFDSGSQNPWLIKTDSSGIVQWYRTYRIGYTFRSIVQASDGGYALAGAGGLWLMKIDNVGNILWTKEYDMVGNNEISSIVHTADGGYVLGGYQQLPNSDAWYAKTDAYGNLQWSRTWGSPDAQESITSLISTSDGGFAFLAWIAQGAWTSFEDYVALVKIDLFGNVQWSRTFGSAGCEDYLSSLVQTSDGGFALAGYRRYSHSDQNFWLIKTNSLGVEQWSKTFGYSFHEAAHSVIATKDGGYMLVGYQSTPSSSYAWIVKTDSSGNLEWSKGYEDGTMAFNVMQTKKWEYIIGGNIRTKAGDMDFWLMKLEGDNNMPTIGEPNRSPAYDVYENQKVNVSVTVNDDISGVSQVLLSYSIDDGYNWINVTMAKISDNSYIGTIPSFATGTKILFKIIAFDNAGNLAVKDNAGQYYSYTVSKAGGLPQPNEILFGIIAFLAFAFAGTYLITWKKRRSRRL